jgi:hypothetical protein
MFVVHRPIRAALSRFLIQVSRRSMSSLNFNSFSVLEDEEVTSTIASAADRSRGIIALSLC